MVFTGKHRERQRGREREKDAKSEDVGYAMDYSSDS